MGALFKMPAAIIYIVGGIWGLILCLGIVHAKLGMIGVIVGLFLFPIVIYLAPWYAGFVKSNWYPLLIVYGSGIAAAILNGIGSTIDAD